MDPVAAQWFARRTTSAAEWPLTELLAAKIRKQQRLAVVIPARNEAATIGEIVGEISAQLGGAGGLVDELVVMNSRSRDDTGSIAAAAGALVHDVDGIRPELGTHPGKGEAIWKSQFVTTADIVIFIDGDLTEWGPHFVTGIAGPLLADENVALCKGFYDRRFNGDPGDESVSGGRVTELVARPLLNLYWPQLAAVVQPLGGEWGIRRDHLRELPVPVGYGVEFATLTDTWTRLGADAVAQVDLGQRGHTHQSVHDLGVMAAEILTVAGRRLGLDVPGAGDLAQFARRPDPGWVPRQVPVVERPPFAGIEGVERRAAAG